MNTLINQRLIALALVFMALALAFGFGSIQAAETIPITTIRHHSSFPVSGIIALAGDNLLVWNWQGRVQLRYPNGGWTDEFSLPIEKHNPANHEDTKINRSGINHIVADKEGMLILEGRDSREQDDLVLLTNSEGKLLDRWAIHPFVQAITSDEKGRRANTVEGIIPLLPKGTLGTVEPFPPDYKNVSSYPSLLTFDWQGAKIFCRDADITMAHYAPIKCQRLGEGGWEFQQWGGLAQQPVCGPWLLIWDSKPETRLTVRSLVTAKLMGKKPFPADQ